MLSHRCCNKVLNACPWLCDFDIETCECGADDAPEEDGGEDPIEPAVLTGKSVGAAQSFDMPPRKMASIHTGSTAVDVQLTYVFLAATNRQRV